MVNHISLQFKKYFRYDCLFFFFSIQYTNLGSKITNNYSSTVKVKTYCLVNYVLICTSYLLSLFPMIIDQCTSNILYISLHIAIVLFSIVWRIIYFYWNFMRLHVWYMNLQLFYETDWENWMNDYQRYCYKYMSMSVM